MALVARATVALVLVAAILVALAAPAAAGASVDIYTSEITGTGVSHCGLARQQEDAVAK